MKRRIFIASVCILLACLSLGLFASAETAAVANDPSVDYVKQTAPYEDESIDLWFEHSFDKIYTDDTTPSGMDTYSVYMAKNEIENAQFVLASDETHTDMTATVSSFTDANGNTIKASLYYQMYVTTSGLDTTNYIGADENPNLVREGETPDPVVSFAAIRRKFQLNAGKSQAFYIRLKTTEETVSGWYSAQLDIKNSSGQIVKTATVYAYVWDFAIAEETALQTAFYLPLATAQGNYTYQAAYDYFLENRIMIMDVPGNLNSENEYLTNPRVNAIRVNSTGGGQTHTYKDHIYNYAGYADIYADLSSMPEWEAIKDKFYFYTCDEIMSQEMHDGQVAGGHAGCETADDAILAANTIAKYWPGAQTVVPIHENTPYPYYYYQTADGTPVPISQWAQNDIKDNIQAMIDNDGCVIWCPQARCFTPNELLKELGYDGNVTPVGARTVHGTVSGNIRASESYFNWDDVFGMTKDRAISSNIVKNASGEKDVEFKFWSYIASHSGSYSYANFLIENSGLQTKMQMWQLYQEDVTGYLYYDVAGWDSYLDTTVTGNVTGTAFPTAPTVSGGGTIWGMGVLSYTGGHAGNSAGVIGTVRVEHLRDGIEDYQMFTMLEELRSEAEAEAIVNSVCNNIVEYLSLPNYDRSAYDSALTDSDIMAMKRIELGNAVEEASKDVCSKHEWDEGVVIKDATCKEMGEISYTCTKCGADKQEFTPALHTEGSCLEKVSEIAATCTENGKIYYECTICDFGTYETIPMHHDISKLKVEFTDKYHTGTCAVCGTIVLDEAHIYITTHTNTCTESGTVDQVCYYCGHTVEGEEEIAAKGHYYVDGVCATCGESETPEVVVVKGNVDGDADGQVSIADLFAMKAYLIGSSELDAAEFEAADLDYDGDVDITDFYGLKKYLISGEW